MQRLFDIFFSSLALIFFLPLFFVIGVLLKLSGEGMIFFSQTRMGLGKKSFNLYKFATMLENSPYIGTKTVTIKNDPRILPFGKFLRKTKINELPQLFNVLKGEMSIIGPRPMTEKNFKFYNKKVRDVISNNPPGLSGVGSIIFRNEENILNMGEHTLDFFQLEITPYKGELECWYEANKGIKLYFKLIFITIWVIIVPKSKIIWTSYNSIPRPSNSLISVLNYPTD